MNRKESLLKIKQVAFDDGFTFLDVVPMFVGTEPDLIKGYLKTAYDLGFIIVSANGLTYYPTQKLKNLK